MSTALDEDVSVLESMDFEFAPPCEHSQHQEHGHDGPGDLIVAVSCPGVCDSPIDLILCKPCYGEPDDYIECSDCGHVAHKHAFWRVLGHVKDFKGRV